MVDLLRLKKDLIRLSLSILLFFFWQGEGEWVGDYMASISKYIILSGCLKKVVCK